MHIADGYRFSPAERRAIQSVADATALEVRRVLPALPRQLLLRVEAGRNVIPETGETGTFAPPNVVMWTVDPHRDGGVARVVQTWLRASLAHELRGHSDGAAAPGIILELICPATLDRAAARRFCEGP